jgi:phosphatidylserine/phosphatidylglycerophosphate/cardiolipin synthase-like enzyme
MTRHQLLIFPRDKVAYHKLIEQTHRQLLISRQALPNIDFCNLLARTKDRGVDIQLLLSDPGYFETHSADEIAKEHQISYDMALYSKVTLGEKAHFIHYVREHGIAVRFVNHHKTFLNHSKYMIMDNRQVFTGSAPNDHTTRLDMGIVISDNTVINTFQHLFYNDFNDSEWYTLIPSSITIAPYNLRKNIENLLLQARESIYLMFPVITDDPRILKIIQNKITQGVTVSILCSPDIFLTSEGPNIDMQYNEKLRRYGALVKEWYEPIIHNRCIMIDPDNTQGFPKKIFLGSGNLKTSSLDKSRETGLIIDKSDIINEVRHIFQQLWER